MQRRTFLSLLALPALAHFLQGCGDDLAAPNGSAGTAGNNSGNRAALKGTAPLVATTTDDAVAATSSVNAFAADLFDRLVAIDPAANLVFSPTSIALALAMTSAGAKGTTLDELHAVLHITDAAGIHRSMNGLATALAAVNQSVDNTAEGGEGTSEVQLSIANSLWGQTGLEFEQAFLDLLSSEYDAGMELCDYIGNPEAARGAINEWVAQQTNDRIPELLTEGTITTASRLTLVNAIYLKANWANVFPDGNTEDAPFATPGGEVTVQMMRATNELGYAAGDGWQAVDVPYVFGDLAFTVAIGETAEAPLPAADEVFAALERRQVQLRLPRFDIETATSLAEVLGAMGMATAFSVAADFSGMTEAMPLMIGDVIHQANITVDEQGTEAAAATAVLMEPTSEAMPEEPIEVTFDRPFTFWLRHRLTGTVVFMGRVNDPSATR
jgi:serpin B